MQYSSCYSETKHGLQFYSKVEATNFDNDIANTDDYKSLKYKAKLLWDTAIQFYPY